MSGWTAHELELDPLVATSSAAIGEPVEVRAWNHPGRRDAGVGHIDDRVHECRVLSRFPFRERHSSDGDALAIEGERCLDLDGESRHLTAPTGRDICVVVVGEGL